MSKPQRTTDIPDRSEVLNGRNLRGDQRLINAVVSAPAPRQPRSTIADKVTRAAMALPLRDLGIAPWLAVVVVVAGADAIVVTMCGLLTPKDSTFAHGSRHTLETQQFHQQDFVVSAELLRQEIERITDIPAIKASVDVDTTSGSVVYTFATADVLSVRLPTEHCHADDLAASEIAYQP